MSMILTYESYKYKRKASFIELKTKLNFEIFNFF